MTKSGVSSDQVLLMTCRVGIRTSHGNTIQAHALLDPVSSTSFITEHLARQLHLSRKQQFVEVDGIGGITDKSSHSVVQLNVHPSNFGRRNIAVEAVVLPKVTLNLPVRIVSYDHSWTHLSGIQLADPQFGKPGKINLLLGVDAFSDIFLNGRWSGPPGTPSAFKTQFGWIMSGKIYTKKDLQASHFQMQSGGYQSVLKR